MKTASTILILSFLAFLAACGPVSSINPLFTATDTVFDPALLGNWSSEGSGPGLVRFEKGESNSYRVVSTEFDDSNGSYAETAYKAHLVILGGQRFLDVTPEQLTAESASYALHLAQAAGSSGAGSMFVRAGDGLYLELTKGQSGSSTTLHLKRAHWIFRLQTDGQNMSLAGLDDEWLKKAIDEGRVALSHRMTDNDHPELVVTASTSDLRNLVTEHAADAEAFSNPLILHRLN